MAELTANFAAATPIESTLVGVTAAAVHLISGGDCADVLFIKDGEHQSVAATSEVAPMVDADHQRMARRRFTICQTPTSRIRGTGNRRTRRSS